MWTLFASPDARHNLLPEAAHSRGQSWDFNIPADIKAYLAELDEFIEREIKPLERENDFND
ncbi:MAG TPA: hypothetical protein VN742_08420 [Candidatus Binataceae bacterium]|nr:hypothetical protein [Candidatus Binataceae bacterium]